MMKVTHYFIVLLFLNTLLYAENQKHLFILSGQSNMVGMKPEDSFIPTLLKKYQKDEILVIKDAHSGQSIRSWVKVNLEFPPPTKGRVPKIRGDLYRKLMAKVKPLIHNKSFKSISYIWMQGESDIRNTAYTSYLEHLMGQLSEDLNSKKIHLVIGRISDCGLKSEKRLAGKINIRKTQVEFAQTYPFGSWIDTDDLNNLEKNGKQVDDLHYSKEGYFELGKRFAEEAIKLIDKHLNSKPFTEKKESVIHKIITSFHCGAPFRNNAVLQQGIHLPVWGTAEPGSKINLKFINQDKTIVTSKNGKWQVSLDPLKAETLTNINQKPKTHTMIIECSKGDNKSKIEFQNLAIGEVWLCSGQSNMAGSMRTIVVKVNGEPHPKGILKDIKLKYFPADTYTNSNYPALRQFASDKPNDWVVCSPKDIIQFRKVAYFFGQKLLKELKVPIGLIVAAKGGSRIETWVSQDITPNGGNHERLMKPLIPYGIRGICWYQGESNSSDKRLYYPKLRRLIRGWRTSWELKSPVSSLNPYSALPVYFVQLPGIGESSLDNPKGGDGRAEIRQAYTEALKIPNTGMAIAIDLGAIQEHPPGKVDTGLRLARLALHHQYQNKDLVPSGPLYTNHKIEGNSIRITFEHAQNGLMFAIKDGYAAPTKIIDKPLQWISIKAEDGSWHWADAKIDGTELLVSSKKVKKPTAVRYAYTNHPKGVLLYNKDGIPAGPFSTCGYEP